MVCVALVFGYGFVDLAFCTLVFILSLFALPIKENLPPKEEFVTVLLVVDIFFYPDCCLVCFYLCA